MGEMVNAELRGDKVCPADGNAVHIDMLGPAAVRHTGALRGAAKAYWRNVKERPVFMLALPVLTFIVLCSLSVLGVVLGANKYESDSRSRAESAALDWAASFRLSIDKQLAPLVTLSIFIQNNPQFAVLQKAFPAIASQLLESVNTANTVSIQELQVSPMGVIELIYPKNNQTDARLGINVFQQPALRGGALKTIQQREIVMNGPLNLVDGNFGSIARIPIFIHNSTLNETFGTNLSLPYDCSHLCFNAATGEKFWGFATAIAPLDDLRAGNDLRLDLLKQKGYLWLMTRPYTSTEREDRTLYRPEWTDRKGHYVFANSSRWPAAQAVESDIFIGNSVWKVYLEPEEGWRPSWEHGVIAAVVLGNMLLAVLVGMIMASWAQQHRLLGDVMESNVRLADTTAKLQEEKLRLDALLVRQYNLLAVLGGRSGGSANTNNTNKDNHSPDNSTMSSSKEGLTLERIESTRRQLAVNSNTSTQDLESIQALDLLGEGTFGKVYKGLWHGTVVAVKTMLLPANMSGAEKRQKMAVMEAAISSSLSHPNIVQTYTYAIRPMREVGDHHQGSNDNQATATEQTAGAATTNMVSRTSPVQRSGESMSAVHSYEVRLVLEFCDKGCLRDALDDGVFMMGAGGGVNYLAILDTAADVAKAMLHLHSLNVLHSDLKARNVMLSTGNADGRGVVGKVGDFGLSVNLNLLETHISQVYQGTMTHMAPEILLDGRISKAADVYAFGITLWELYTGGKPFEGIPRALLGHQITRENLRPKFPEGTPMAYLALAARCWQPSWDKRPTFAEVLDDLVAMRAADPRPTCPLSVVPRVHPSSLTAAAPSNGSRSGTISSKPSTTGQRTSSFPLAANASSLPKVAPCSEGEQSYYLEGSIDDSDILVMKSMTGWSQAASGMNSSVQRMRPLMMPQIPEAGEGQHHRQEEQLEQLEQQQRRQQQQQQKEGQEGEARKGQHHQQQQQGSSSLQ